MDKVRVIGGGLAGCEAAWQLARRGIPVLLSEMRPQRTTPAHRTGQLAELVCSNSLKSMRTDRAGGLLKAELTMAGSLILEAAAKAAVPGGSSLCVDREEFADRVTGAIEDCPEITVTREEVTKVPEGGLTVVATGPLTSDALADSIIEALGSSSLAFYDAIAPTIEADSINWDRVFIQDRYHDAEESSYVNCPLDEEQYINLVKELLGGDMVTPRDFEDPSYFEACMPVEVLAARGERTLAFGPMRPTGLTDPKTGRRPHAVVQLRPENREKSLYGMVGFQTRLKIPEQKRIFSMITGLEKAEFERHGSMHRNTFLNAPEVLDGLQRSRKDPKVLFAGQLTGVEGYVESVASGLMAGIYAYEMASGLTPAPPPVTTMTGAILHHLTVAEKKGFQPVNAQLGLLPQPEGPRMKKDAKRRFLAERALEEMTSYLEDAGLKLPPGN
jgi:methylenetetrahydrofolate--tRNA-(uracil-5-)-methyltransferase